MELGLQDYGELMVALQDMGTARAQRNPFGADGEGDAGDPGCRQGYACECGLGHCDEVFEVFFESELLSVRVARYDIGALNARTEKGGRTPLTSTPWPLFSNVQSKIPSSTSPVFFKTLTKSSLRKS